MIFFIYFFFFFFFNDTATTEIYTLSLHDALPISLTWASWFERKTTLPASCLPADAAPAPPREAAATRARAAAIPVMALCMCRILRTVPSFLFVPPYGRSKDAGHAA